MSCCCSLVNRALTAECLRRVAEKIVAEHADRLLIKDCSFQVTEEEFCSFWAQVGPWIRILQLGTTIVSPQLFQALGDLEPNPFPNGLRLRIRLGDELPEHDTFKRLCVSLGHLLRKERGEANCLELLRHSPSLCDLPKLEQIPTVRIAFTSRYPHDRYLTLDNLLEILSSWESASSPGKICLSLAQYRPEVCSLLGSFRLWRHVQELIVYDRVFRFERTTLYALLCMLAASQNPRVGHSSALRLLRGSDVLRLLPMYLANPKILAEIKPVQRLCKEESWAQKDDALWGRL